MLGELPDLWSSVTMKPEELTDPNPDFTQMFWFLSHFLARMSGGLAPHTVIPASAHQVTENAGVTLEQVNTGL